MKTSFPFLVLAFVATLILSVFHFSSCISSDETVENHYLFSVVYQTESENPTVLSYIKTTNEQLEKIYANEAFVGNDPLANSIYEKMITEGNFQKLVNDISVSIDDPTLSVTVSMLKNKNPFRTTRYTVTK